MKSKLFALLFTLTAFTFAAHAQIKPPGEPKPDVPNADVTKKPGALTAKDYEDLLAKLKKGDTSIDFAKLRLAYTETEDYSPYGGGGLRAAMIKALNANKYKDAAKSAEEMLKTNYVDLHAHFTLMSVLDKLEKPDDAEFHSKVFDGLMAAIKQNDGLTAKTAMISIGISEQYFIMESLGYEKQSKALVNDGGSMFDVHTSFNAATKDTRKFYFNIDKVFGRLFK